VNALSALYTHNKGASGVGKVKAYRHIPSAPERILDAPALVDDYYLKLLDWSSANTLAVALGPTVYLWDAGSGSISELCSLPGPEDYVTSVAWIKEGGAHLAIGTAGADVQLWDCERARQIRSMKGHAGRVGALDWNAHILTSGSRDAAIHNHDVRIREHHVSTLAGHTHAVESLAALPRGLLASGSRDTSVRVWSVAARACVAVLEGRMTEVYGLAALSDGRLASGSTGDDGMVCVWDVGHLNAGASATAADTTGPPCPTCGQRTLGPLPNTGGTHLCFLCRHLVGGGPAGGAGGGCALT
jgi:cell division cycle protein 20 (cofactor of APC complex)